MMSLAPSLTGYRRSWLKADLIAGLSAGAVVVPQAMAYATIAGLPVEFGLYTCMVPVVVYALIGGSRAMSVSTTSTIAVLTASSFTVAGITAGSDAAESDLITLTFLVGVLLLIARLLKLGGLVENISQATLTGIKVGVGLTVAASQLPKLLGVASDPDASGFFSVLGSALSKLSDANGATVVLSLISIGLLLGISRFLPRVPGPLVVVGLGIMLIAFTDLKGRGVDVIDHVPQGIPAPDLPPFDHVGGLLPGALAIALMAFLETVSVARGIRAAGEPQIDSNRELFASGAASFVGSVFHTLPAAGGFSQSAVSLRAGAKSQASALVTAALAVVVALFLGPILDDLPQATLGAMVLVATLGLVDVRGLARLWRIDKLEFWIAAATGVIGLTRGLLAAVLVGVLATLYLVLRELDRPHVVVVTRGAGGEWTELDDDEPAPAADSPLILRFQTGLYTANVRTNLDVVRAFVDQGQVRSIVLDLSRLRMTPVMVLDGLRDLDAELAADGVRVRFAGLPSRPRAMAERTRWWRAVEADGRAYGSLDKAFADARSEH